MFNNNQMGYNAQMPNNSFGSTQSFLQNGFGGYQQPQQQQLQIPSMQQLQQAVYQTLMGLINNSAGCNIGLIIAANRTLMTNEVLFQTTVNMAATYIDYIVRNFNQNPQQAVIDVCNNIHGGFIADERAAQAGVLHQYDPSFLARLDAFKNEMSKIVNVVRQITTPQQGLISPQNSYQTTGAALGGQQYGQQGAAPGVVLLHEDSQARDSVRVLSAFDASPRIMGMPTVGTIPTRQIRRADGSVVDLHDAAEELHSPKTTQQPTDQNLYQNHGHSGQLATGGYQTDNGMVILADDPNKAPSVWDLRQQQLSMISQQQENGEEVPIIFNRPNYQNVPETRNEADRFYDDVFGENSKPAPMPTAGWQGFVAPDPEQLAAAGIVRKGAATSGFDDSVFESVEDAFIAEHYPDMATGSIGSMNQYADAIKSGDMYPGTSGLSLMDLAQQTPGSIPTNVESKAMANELEVIDFATLSDSSKAAILENKHNRHIAPAYVAGRSRTVVIKSLGGGKITVEAKRMNYNIHETEILAPVKTPLTGALGNPANADQALTLALTTANEQHYRKLIEEKSSKGEDLTTLLADGPMLEMAGLVSTPSLKEAAASAQAALFERLGDRVSEISLDTSINFNAFSSGRYILSGDSLALALSITRAKTTATICARAQDFFEESNFPVREQHRLHAAMTAEVNRLLQITFHPEYHVDSFSNDLDAITTLLHENAEENVRESLQAIYSQAAKTVFSVHTLASLKKRLASAEEETGLTEEYDCGVFAGITNVTLLPFNYADYPIAFTGNLGRVTKENLPKLYEVMAGIIEPRTAEGVFKYVVITEDYQIIEFFKPVLADDEALYIARN